VSPRLRIRRTRSDRGIPRATSIPIKGVKLATFAAGTLVPSDPGIRRPRTRSDCYGFARPCGFVGCRHHLYLEVNPETGTIKLNRPDLAPEELKESCSLDVAERGGLTLEEVGEITNLTRERVRQIEVGALIALKRTPSIEEIAA